MATKNIFVIRREIIPVEGIPHSIAIELIRILLTLAVNGLGPYIIQEQSNKLGLYYYTMSVDITETPILLRWIYRRRIHKIIQEFSGGGNGK